MDKNTLTGFALIGAVLIGFSYWNRQATPAEASTEEVASVSAVSSVDTVKASALIEPDTLQSEAQLLTLCNGKVEVTLSTKGATVAEARILGYKDQQGNDVTLLAPDDQAMRLQLAAKTENIDLSQANFTPSDVTDSTATLTLATMDGGSLSVRYRLRPESYMLDMTVQAQGLAPHFLPTSNQLSISWSHRAKQQEKGYTFENRYSTLTYKKVGKGTSKLSEGKDDDEQPEESLDWVAFKSQFFSAILIGHQGLSAAQLQSTQLAKGSGYLKEYQAEMQTPFDPTGAEPTTLQLYLGPNDFHILKAANKLSASNKDLQLHELVYFGWPVIRWINRYFIIYLFDWLSSLGLSMGMVLLLLTLIVKALVYPANRKSYLSSARMRVLKPEIDKISAKYPNREDAMKKQQEMMSLYSQYGVSPMGGCLPMLIQMPVWIALFNFVPNAIELRGESFLWASDLSTYDDVIHWGRSIWLLGDHVSIFALLFALTNIGNTLISMKQQQNSMMSGEQAQQMKMMKYMMYVMPVAFFFIFNDYSSGLCYYYTLSGLLSLVIMWALRHFTDDAKLLAQLQAYKQRHKGDQRNGGTLAARLEALSKAAQEQRQR